MWHLISTIDHQEIPHRSEVGALRMTFDLTDREWDWIESLTSDLL